MVECGDTRHEKLENRRKKNRIRKVQNGFQAVFASECCFLFKSHCLEVLWAGAYRYGSDLFAADDACFDRVCYASY